MNNSNIIVDKVKISQSPMMAKMEGSDLNEERPQEIYFLGKDFNQMAHLIIGEKTIKIDIAKKDYNSDYIPEENIYIAIFDTKGDRVFQKSLSVAEIKAEKIEIPFEMGYQLDMYHPIPSRLISSPDLYPIINTEAQLTTFVMTQLGVINPKIGSYSDIIHPDSAMIKTEIVAPLSITDTAPANPAPAVNSNTKIPEPKLMVSFQFKLLGLCDYEIATVTIDEESKLMGINILRDSPHCHFRNELYASIKVKDKQGQTTFEEKLYGTEANISNTFIPFEKGYQLEIFHAEPDRLRVSSGDSQILASVSKHNDFLMTHVGLENRVQETAKEKINHHINSDNLVPAMSVFGDIDTAPVGFIHAHVSDSNKYHNIMNTFE